MRFRKGSLQHESGSFDLLLTYMRADRLRCGVFGRLFVSVQKAEREMKRTRILLADDDPLMRAGISTLLQTEFQVIDAVSDGSSLVAAAFKLHPDVIVTDISMPKMNGIEAVRTIRRFLPNIKVIFLTMHNGNGYRKGAQGVGAVGYVLKSAAREELNQAIHHAMRGLA
jgi:DNA-binding NarL/FixJ family response regulator